MEMVLNGNALERWTTNLGEWKENNSGKPNQETTDFCLEAVKRSDAAIWPSNFDATARHVHRPFALSERPWRVPFHRALIPLQVSRDSREAHLKYQATPRLCFPDSTPANVAILNQVQSRWPDCRIGTA
jgi:hypothetical protein